MVQTRKYYLKNHYLTLKSKVKVTGRSLCTRHTALWSCSHIPNIIDLSRKKHYLTLRSKSNKGHYGMRHTALWSCTYTPNIFDLSRKTKNVMARKRKYYLKNNYLTFMSKVKVQRRSLLCASHRLMDMHPHTKYH